MNEYELITPAERNRLEEGRLLAELGYWRARKELWEAFRAFEAIFKLDPHDVQSASPEVRALREVFVSKLRG